MQASRGRDRDCSFDFELPDFSLSSVRNEKAQGPCFEATGARPEITLRRFA